jgi:hypothetical protein
MLLHLLPSHIIDAARGPLWIRVNGILLLNSAGIRDQVSVPLPVESYFTRDVAASPGENLLRLVVILE